MIQRREKTHYYVLEQGFLTFSNLKQNSPQDNIVLQCYIFLA